MLNLLNKIDGSLASLRLAMVTDDSSLIDSAIGDVKKTLSEVASHPGAKKYPAAAAEFEKDLPKALDAFAAAAKGNKKDQAIKALDGITKVISTFKPIVEGQPTNRNHI